MVKTYILAPNWTTSPPPDGPVKLGHLLDDLTELIPINRDEVVEIPPEHLNKVDTKSGFKTSRSKLVSGELGLFARVMGLMAVGVGAGIYYKKDKDDVLSCKTLDTMTFDPTEKYIADSMDLPETKKYMHGCQFKAPVYMVTGLKIGRGGSLQSSNSRDGGVTLEGGLSPSGSPVQIRGKGGFVQRKVEGESWEGSTDFIVAFRVRKIWYYHGELKNKTHKKDVVMQDGTSVQKGPDMTLRVDDHIPLTDVFTDVELTTDNDIENGEEVNWVIPNVHMEST
ncbi:unnamed protein product [Fusarium graminearum]|nr:unnamed protein product [Fusarium graminearum]VTO82722.1 unnamed protein product [Fusarium graminearum]